MFVLTTYRRHDLHEIVSFTDAARAHTAFGNATMAGYGAVLVALGTSGAILRTRKNTACGNVDTIPLDLI